MRSASRPATSAPTAAAEQRRGHGEAERASGRAKWSPIALTAPLMTAVS